MYQTDSNNPVLCIFCIHYISLRKCARNVQSIVSMVDGTKSTNGEYLNCEDERKRRFFGCGRKGKYYVDCGK